MRFIHEPVTNVGQTTPKIGPNILYSLYFINGIERDKYMANVGDFGPIQKGRCNYWADNISEYSALVIMTRLGSAPAQ